MKRGMHCIVSGHVQGVFFRSNTQQVADKYGLTGWVRNCVDGSVECTAYGDEESLKLLKDWLKRGPEHARVTEVKCERIDYNDVEDKGDFVVTY